jgi:hypothetical protein
MRTDLQILRAAIGDASLTDVEHDERCEIGAMRFYRVKLPLPRYRGLPPVWHFAIAARGSGSPMSVDELLQEARELIRKNVTDATPLVLVCEYENVRLADHLRYDGKNVFFVDAHALPGAKHLPTEPRSAPFVQAVRRKLDAKDLATICFNPYQPDGPVTGWKFFGRKRELERLVDSEENVFVIGARKIGKTSLLNEAKTRLIARGETVYMPNIQFMETPEQVVTAIIHALSARDLEAAKRRSKALSEELLATVLRQASGLHRRVTLILDEFGNVVFNSRKQDWRAFGILRAFSHAGTLRVIMSGFQEFSIKQSEDFSGPLVNLAGEMKLGGFGDGEIEELLIEPLKIWGQVRDGKALLRMITAQIGRHPCLLQYLGQSVFKTMFEMGNKDAETIVSSLLRGAGLSDLAAPIDMLFLKIRSAASRYLFLKCCQDAECENLPLHQAELSSESIERHLRALGYASTVSGRGLLLDDLQLRGLTVPANASGSRQRIAAPIVYVFLKASEPDFEYLLKSLAGEIIYERARLMHGVPEEAERGALP